MDKHETNADFPMPVDADSGFTRNSNYAILGIDIAVLKNRDFVYEQAISQNPNRWSGTTHNWERIEAARLNPKNLNKKLTNSVKMAEQILLDN